MHIKKHKIILRIKVSFIFHNMKSYKILQVTNKSIEIKPKKQRVAWPSFKQLKCTLKKQTTPSSSQNSQDDYFTRLIKNKEDQLKEKSKTRKKDLIKKLIKQKQDDSKHQLSIKTITQFQDHNLNPPPEFQKFERSYRESPRETPVIDEINDLKINTQKQKQKKSRSIKKQDSINDNNHGFHNEYIITNALLKTSKKTIPEGFSNFKNQLKHKSLIQLRRIVQNDQLITEIIPISQIKKIEKLTSINLKRIEQLSRPKFAPKFIQNQPKPVKQKIKQKAEENDTFNFIRTSQRKKISNLSSMLQLKSKPPTPNKKSIQLSIQEDLIRKMITRTDIRKSILQAVIQKQSRIK